MKMELMEAMRERAKVPERKEKSNDEKKPFPRKKQDES
jgi:hypothetical protein